MSGNESSGGSSCLWPQSSMFHQIPPPQPLAFKLIREDAKNSKLWKKYNSYFVISMLNRENPKYHLTMLTTRSEMML